MQAHGACRHCGSANAGVVGNDHPGAPKRCHVKGGLLAFVASWIGRRLWLWYFIAVIDRNVKAGRSVKYRG
jgi:hypothetical protein